MTIKLIVENQSLSEKEITDREREIGRRLPEDYRAFLLRSNGAEPELNKFDVPPNNSSSVREFYSLDQQREEKKALSGYLPDNSWPVAYDGCGNIISLTWNDGSWWVTFWDHELEREILISNSFSGFMDMLSPFDIRASQFDNAQVIYVEVHTPSFNAGDKNNDKE